MTTDRDDDLLVERVFASARRGESAPKGDFLARLVGEAEALQPAAPPPKPATGAAARPKSGLRAFFGGWPGLGGMTAAMLAGLWIGIAPPTALTTLAAQMTGQVIEIGIYGETDLLAFLED